MKVLWVGDTPTVSTGFSRCTRVVCDELHRAGHEVHVIGISESGEPRNGYPYPIYPPKYRGSGDEMGIRRTASMVDALRPDIVVLLNDPWNVAEYLEAMDELCVAKPRPPVVAWLAVDAKNHPHSALLNRLAHVITWTQFGIDELRHGGYTGSSSIVPLGCNQSIYRPLDRKSCRDFVIPEGHPAHNGFIFGVVGRNQPRKRIDLAIDYFAQFLGDHNPTDAYLYLQVAPTGERACDVRALAAYYGPQLQGRILLSTPDVGLGLSEDIMAAVYNSLDVCMTTTQGEGWGLTTHEAMACGVACLVPDYSALGEWPGDAVLKVPCTGTALSAPLNFFPYTVGGIMDKTAAVRAMAKLYSSRAFRGVLGAAGYELVSKPELQWPYIGRCLRYELEGLVGTAKQAAELPQVESEDVTSRVAEGTPDEYPLPTTEPLQQLELFKS